ncbi:hypothetical protein A2U01_0014211, partial [Trifolium medium]|nr:hypothetical protein [Trifolium medium]
SYNPPFYSNNTHITSPSPSLSFNHDYTPPTPNSCPRDSNSSNPYAYGYSSYYNYYQHTSLSPSILTPNTTLTLQQQANVVQQPFYPQQPLNTSIPMCHHVGLTSQQNQTHPPTYVPPQTAPPSFPTHTIHTPSSYFNHLHTQPISLSLDSSKKGHSIPLKPHKHEALSQTPLPLSPHQPLIQQQSVVESSAVPHRVVDEQIYASRLALQTTLQKLSNSFKTLRENLQEKFVEENQEETEEEEESEFLVSPKTSTNVSSPVGEMNPSNPTPKPPQLEFDKEKNGFVQLLPPSAPPEPPVNSPKLGPPFTSLLLKPPDPPPEPEPPDLLKPQPPPQAESPFINPAPPPSIPPDLPIVQMQPPAPPFSSETLFTHPFPRPPPKPPNMKSPFSVAHLPYYTLPEIFVVKELFDFLSLKGAHQTQSPP